LHVLADMPGHCIICTFWAELPTMHTSQVPVPGLAWLRERHWEGFAWSWRWGGAGAPGASTGHCSSWFQRGTFSVYWCTPLFI